MIPEQPTYADIAPLLQELEPLHVAVIWSAKPPPGTSRVFHWTTVSDVIASAAEKFNRGLSFKRITVNVAIGEQLMRLPQFVLDTAQMMELVHDIAAKVSRCGWLVGVPVHLAVMDDNAIIIDRSNGGTVLLEITDGGQL